MIPTGALPTAMAARTEPDDGQRISCSEKDDCNDDLGQGFESEMVKCSLRHLGDVECLPNSCGAVLKQH